MQELITDWLKHINLVISNQELQGKFSVQLGFLVVYERRACYLCVSISIWRKRKFARLRIPYRNDAGIFCLNGSARSVRNRIHRHYKNFVL